VAAWIYFISYRILSVIFKVLSGAELGAGAGRPNILNKTINSVKEGVNNVSG
jgi:hypothetical protein